MARRPPRGPGAGDDIPGQRPATPAGDAADDGPFDYERLEEYGARTPDRASTRQPQTDGAPRRQAVNDDVPRRPPAGEGAPGNAAPGGAPVAARGPGGPARSGDHPGASASASTTSDAGTAQAAGAPSAGVPTAGAPSADAPTAGAPPARPPGAGAAAAGPARAIAPLDSGTRAIPPLEGAPPKQPGPPPVVHPAKKGKRSKRTRGERVVRWAVVIVAFVLVVSGAVYGYLWYRLGQIKSVKCPACAVEVAGAPYNVLIVGSDSRAGDTGNAAKAFGSAAQVGGQRSDTIKVLHVDPAAGTARLLSIPRDTYVQLSGMPSGTGLATDNKINTAFNSGPTPLIETIENTFGITINHFVVINFDGVINLVNSVGGIRLDFRYPVRDNDNGNNNSGLSITHAGCQELNGNMALALARSRYYEYEVRPYVWEYDGSGDLGRIQRQNTVIESIIDTAKSNYNPLAVNSFLESIVRDITKDDALSTGDMISLAQRYHAFSGSALQTFTLPTVGDSSQSAGAVEVVQEPQARQVITQFLGTAPNDVVTAPLSADGTPVTVPSTTTTTEAPRTTEAGSSPPTTAQPGSGSFNPTPC